MATRLLSLFCICAVCTSGMTSTNCSYDFSGGKDIIFLLDSSGSVSDLTLEGVRTFMRSLIRQRIRMGPEEDFTRISLISFYKDTHYLFEDTNFIGQPVPVYEAEFLSPSGLVDRRIRKTAAPPDKDPDETGFAESLLGSRRLFVNNNVQTRPKILVMITDFHFDAELGDKNREISRVLEVITTLRMSVTSLGGTLNAYGVGVGTYFNNTNMETVLKAANGVTDVCGGKSNSDWLAYIRDAGRIDVKGDSTYGPRRAFYDASLCCYLCQEQTNQSVANCSLEEFRSDFSIRDVKESPSLVPLQCSSTGMADMCLVTDTTRMTTVTSRFPELPEGPDDPDPSDGDEGGSKGDDDDDDDDDDPSETSISALMVIFGIINLVLIIMFILVCIYAHRLEAPKTKHEEQPREENNRNIYNTSSVVDSEQRSRSGTTRTLMPTRQAPVLPNPRSSPDNRSGIDNAAHQADEIYGNQWVADEVQANDRRTTQHVNINPIGRMDSDVTERIDSSATQWSEWSCSESSGYVRPSSVDGESLSPPTELSEDRNDYVDIPDSAVRDLEDDRGDYVNMSQERISYLGAVKIDAVARLKRFHNWSRNVHNRGSRGGDNLNELETATNQNTPHSSIPLTEEVIRNKPISVKRPSLFQKLLRKANKDYVNENVIQNLHDQHQQRGPGPSQKSGNGDELQQILNARFKKLKQKEDEVETSGVDEVNDRAFYELRKQRGIDNGVDAN